MHAAALVMQLRPRIVEHSVAHGCVIGGYKACPAVVTVLPGVVSGASKLGCLSPVMLNVMVFISPTNYCVLACAVVTTHAVHKLPPVHTDAAIPHHPPPKPT